MRAETKSREANPSVSPRTLAVGRAIGGAAVIIMLGNLTSSVLGFGRAAVIAQVFGANGKTDAFFAASIVPQMFYDLTVGAAISAALIPTFTELVERRDRALLRQTFNSVLTLAWLVLAAVIGGLYVFAHPMMSLILQGYVKNPRHTDFSLSIEIARVLIGTLFFLGSSAVFLSALYSLRRFTVAAFASAFYHVGIIAGALFLARPLGILALPIGALVGAAAQAIVQIPVLLRNGLTYRPSFRLTPEVRRIIRLYGPVAAGLIVSIIGQIVDLHFKWRLAPSDLTDMYYATLLTQFPIGIVVAALSFAVLPSISADAALDRLGDFKSTLATGIRLAFFLTIPAAVGYIVLAVPIVSLLFQHGQHFSHHNTLGTAIALAGYAIQIPFVGLDQLLIFAFYARRNTVTPMLVGIAGVGIYIVSALILMPRLHILGLALANTFQNSLHALILLVLLLISMGALAGHGILRSAGKSLASAALMGAAALTSAQALGSLIDGQTLAGKVTAALIPLSIAVVVYVGLSALFRSEELALAWQVARSKVGSTTHPAG